MARIRVVPLDDSLKAAVALQDDAVKTVRQAIVAEYAAMRQEALGQSRPGQQIIQDHTIDVLTKLRQALATLPIRVPDEAFEVPYAPPPLE